MPNMKTFIRIQLKYTQYLGNCTKKLNCSPKAYDNLRQVYYIRSNNLFLRTDIEPTRNS